jgi:hypothetical protein
MFAGACLAPNLVGADKVIRKDGSKVIMMQHPTWRTEALGLWECLRTDTWILYLFPMFFASNWFYTYHFNVCIPVFSCGAFIDKYRTLISQISISAPVVSTTLLTGAHKSSVHGHSPAGTTGHVSGDAFAPFVPSCSSAFTHW